MEKYCSLSQFCPNTDFEENKMFCPASFMVDKKTALESVFTKE